MVVLTINSLVMVAVMVVLMVLMMYLYMKVRVPVVMMLVFVFSLVFGGLAIVELSIPFSPYTQIFFLLFQTIFFVITMFEAFNLGKK